MKKILGRLKHSFRVAEKMKQAIENNPQLCDSTAEEMFLLGFLHDIGYNFVAKQEEHENEAGELLRKEDYKFWKDVYYHGTPASEYKSPELELLNWADMTVNQKGCDVTPEERLEDIARRYGIESIQYINAALLKEEIKKWMNDVGL